MAGKEQGPSTGPAALLAGLTTLIGALTAVATANGAVTRLFRNHPVLTAIALICVLAAFLCGLLLVVAKEAFRATLVRLGSVLLVLGLGLALIAQVATLSLSDRPTIAVTSRPRGADVELDASVRVAEAKAHDQLVVVMYGVTPGGHRTSALYYAKTGPDSGGTLAQQPQLVLIRRKYNGVYVTALVVPEGIKPPAVDCDGNIVDPTGQLRTTIPPGGNRRQPVPFRPNGDNPLVACVTLALP